MPDSSASSPYRNIYRILSPRQRRRFFALVLYLLFAGLMQVAGVGSIAPFIALLSSPELIESRPFLARVYEWTGATGQGEFLSLVAAGLMGLIVVTNLVGALTVWTISSFSMRIGRELQQTIFRGIVRKPLHTFTRLNGSDLISLVTSDTNRFVYMVLQNFATMLSQVFIVLLVIVALLVYDPRVAVVAITMLGGGYLAIFGALRKKMDRTGVKLTQSQKRFMRILNESLGGLKEIKLAGLEESYERRLDSASAEMLRSSTVSSAIGDLPRFALEALAFCALLALGAVMLRNSPPHQIVGILSLYAMAGYRLLPAAQQIFRTAALIRSNADTLARLIPAVEDGRHASVPEVDDVESTFSAVQPITFNDVTFRYPSGDRDVVSNVTFQIKPRTLTVLVGASGAGKSTVADLLLGLLPPDRGSIEIGAAPLDSVRAQWQRRLGFVAQSIYLLDAPIAENIAFGDLVPDPNRLQKAADLARVTEFAETLPEGLNSRVGDRGSLLSGGQRQRIGIARALYRNAQVLVMDEATSALDSITEQGIIQTLHMLKREKTIVMIAHRLSTIQAADHILHFERGRLVADGSYDYLLATSADFRSLVEAGTRGDFVDSSPTPITDAA